MICVIKKAYCSTSGKYTVKHITSQSNAHHQIHSIPAQQEGHIMFCQIMKH